MIKQLKEGQQIISRHGVIYKWDPENERLRMYSSTDQIWIPAMTHIEKVIKNPTMYALIEEWEHPDTESGRIRNQLLRSNHMVECVESGTIFRGGHPLLIWSENDWTESNMSLREICENHDKYRIMYSWEDPACLSGRNRFHLLQGDTLISRLGHTFQYLSHEKVIKMKMKDDCDWVECNIPLYTVCMMPNLTVIKEQK